MVEPRRVRCAVYTRKSSEEGLEQSFNSLHAQREACEAYIASQKHEVWQLIPTAYDDGGFSGGSMERPGLKALLADVEAGLIDTVVVYKVDRLTRALSDFARMVDRFDCRGSPARPGRRSDHAHRTTCTRHRRPAGCDQPPGYRRPGTLRDAPFRIGWISALPFALLKLGTLAFFIVRKFQDAPI
ncbi:recombinase family protein [Sphingomonas sp. Leaf205]|uniref:recombinase family protein n=1 Tax=Sphingomonas sp. Leaf205 TaxID=2876551 RepID=UPI001E52EA10|nr:recombinase family protein [Sphingomonas sp. Leaf205]